MFPPQNFPSCKEISRNSITGSLEAEDTISKFEKEETVNAYNEVPTEKKKEFSRIEDTHREKSRKVKNEKQT